MPKNRFPFHSPYLKNIRCDVRNPVVDDYFHDFLCRRTGSLLGRVVCDTLEIRHAALVRYRPSVSRVHATQPDALLILREQRFRINREYVVDKVAITTCAEEAKQSLLFRP